MIFEQEQRDNKNSEPKDYNIKESGENINSKGQPLRGSTRKFKNCVYKMF
ncbi:hypothetical protein AAAC51_36910 [Priestia megaterium]